MILLYCLIESPVFFEISEIDLVPLSFVYSLSLEVFRIFPFLS